MISHLFRLFAHQRARKLAARTPAHVQWGQLSRLLTLAADTRFGREHGFRRIRSVAEYQRAVPLRRYEDFWNGYWKDAYPRLDNITWPGVVPYFALSSGTSSGTTKYIPVTHEMNRSNTKAGVDLLVHHYLNRPSSRLLEGRIFMLGGSTELRNEAPGVMSGDLSGIAVKNVPWFVAPRYFPPQRLALMKNWEEKIRVLSRESLSKNIRLLSGVPSWLLLFTNALSELRPEAQGKLGRIYPDLEMLVHGGVNFRPYESQFRSILEGSHAELREVYPASEGFVALADRGSGEGLRLMLDHQIFFEFVPREEVGKENPTRHWVENIETGVDYAVVMTTCAGLWSYVIGDTVRFVDRDPPRLLVTGRLSYYLSAFGEHIIEEELVDAITSAAKEIGFAVSDFSVGPVFPATPKDLGGHVYVVECAGTVPTSEDAERFADRVDKKLRALNEDYDGHRAEGFGLRSPQINFVQPGMYSAWMKKSGKHGGQNKETRIITDQGLLQDLLLFSKDFS